MQLWRRAALLVICLVTSASWHDHNNASAATIKAAASSPRIVYTQHGNVYLLDTATGRSQPLTTRGGHGDIIYPWYSWSPDGRYLLLVRGHQSSTSEDLLLMSRDGTLLRTLASPRTATSFRPSWASDADLLSYVSTTTPSAAVPGMIDHLQRLDPRGHHARLWSFSEPSGCGGGTSDLSEQLEWGETGFGSLAMTFYWNSSHHLAVYTNSLCAGAVDVTDTRTGVTRQLGRHPELWHEAAVSRTGVVAATITSASQRLIALTTLQPGAAVHFVAAGELPIWSHDGHTLYFVQRTPGSVLHMRDTANNVADSRTYISSIWRCNADGSGLTRMASFDAFGTGPLQLTPDGHALIFARIDNSRRLWSHRQAGNVVTPALVARYGPGVSVVNLALDGTLITLAADAHMPAVQP